MKKEYVEIEMENKQTTNDTKLWKNKSLRSATIFSLSSKNLSFLSPHLHHKKQHGIILNNASLWEQLNLPFQHAKSSITLWVMTQSKLKQTRYSIPESASHHKGKEMNINSSLLHVQNKSITMIFLCLKLSILRIFWKVAVQINKAILTDDSFHEIFFQIKGLLPLGYWT